MERKLCKSRTNIMIDGVCAGVAKYLNIDVTMVRIIWAILICTGSGILAYIICAVLMPREPASTEDTADYRSYSNHN
ncbi:MAG: PspC domain-containing protein [Clostridiales bacterium]|jgi:phage shock protein PspC (stress-responsive transcriptional regulator)|nr:PspC domain-containing protein [Clostridiales bacterium]